MENVSIIGTGLMGYPMAQNILKAGFNLTAFNRTNKKAQGLSKNGAEVVNSIKEAVEKSKIIITMLSDDDAVLSVISNKDFLENIKKNSIVIDMSSTKPITSKKINEILKKLKFPIFVKPSNSGSSLGISKVKNESEILLALEKAREIDPRILIEEGLEVREIECGIIGNSKLLTSEIGEVNYESDWYDYDSKYNSNNKIIIPAEIDSKISKEIKEIAIKSCSALNIFGFARVDFFLEKSSNKILLNEINTIPGFTKNSMFPMLWKASGLNIEQLVAKLVDISLDL